MHHNDEHIFTRERNTTWNNRKDIDQLSFGGVICHSDKLSPPPHHPQPNFLQIQANRDFPALFTGFKVYDKALIGSLWYFGGLWLFRCETLKNKYGFMGDLRNTTLALCVSHLYFSIYRKLDLPVQRFPTRRKAKQHSKCQLQAESNRPFGKMMKK